MRKNLSLQKKMDLKKSIILRLEKALTVLLETWTLSIQVKRDNTERLCV